MLRSGRTRRSAEQDSVRKWEGLLNTEGRLAIALNLITFPIRAWFLSKIAETKVEMMPLRAARSMLPGDTRS
jgi:hypothetical protein